MNCTNLCSHWILLPKKASQLQRLKDFCFCTGWLTDHSEGETTSHFYDVFFPLVKLHAAWWICFSISYDIFIRKQGLRMVAWLSANQQHNLYPGVNVYIDVENNVVSEHDLHSWWVSDICVSCLQEGIHSNIFISFYILYIHRLIFRSYIPEYSWQTRINSPMIDD